MGSIPGSGRSPGGEHGNPLQYSCLENPMDRGSWQATVHSVAKNRTQLKRLACKLASITLRRMTERDNTIPYSECLDHSILEFRIFQILQREANAQMYIV